MSKVFIVNKGGHDHSDAKRFGELVYLSEGLINPFAVTQMYRQFAELLSDSKENDYILLSGLGVMGAIACSIFTRIHGKLNLLLYRYKKDSGCYIERNILIDELIRREET